ncbi:unnamed protein product [Mytilus edulis]|uniref:Uncharacterized protein n=1 Tax=Mytilus edulis TaxID=6550 RepID=A0A8S3S9H0_MYTED|nr:unnamed protein product [Mytilus edulis]
MMIIFFSYLHLKDKDIPLERCSKDRGRVNKYGNMLIELCKRSGIYICNGRLFADKHIGCTTCKDASLVDYLIMSPCMFDITSDFGIVDFNPMFSDVHNRLYFSFSFPSSNSLNNSHNHTINSNTYIRWDSTKTDDFTQVLTNDTGSSLQQLNDILNSIEIDTATSESVNGLVNDLGRVLLDTAETVFAAKDRQSIPVHVKPRKQKERDIARIHSYIERKNIIRALPFSEPANHRVRERPVQQELENISKQKEESASRINVQEYEHKIQELEDQVIEKDKTVKMVQDLYYMRSTEFTDEIETLKNEKSDLHSKLQFHENSIKQLTAELQNLRHENYMLSSSQNQQRPNHNRHYNNRRGGRFR